RPALSPRSLHDALPIFRGDLGSSLFYSVPAGRLVVQRLPPTLWLIGLGTLFAVLIAVPLAALSATKRDRLPDQIVRAVPLVGLGDRKSTRLNSSHLGIS